MIIIRREVRFRLAVRWDTHLSPSKYHVAYQMFYIRIQRRQVYLTTLLSSLSIKSRSTNVVTDSELKMVLTKVRWFARFFDSYD